MTPSCRPLWPALILAPVPAACGGEGDSLGEVAAVSEPDLGALAAVGYADWEADGGESDGVLRLDPQRAAPGVTLYTDEVNRVFALELDGTPAHVWTIPGRDQVEHALPLGGGRLAAVSVDQGVTVVDADSSVLWEEDLNAHHDVAELGDGALLVPEWVEREYRGRRVRFDRLVRVAADAAPTVVWDAHAGLDELRALHPPLALDAPPEEPSDAVYDYYHLNTVVVLGESALAADPRFRPGNLLLCFRNANLIVVLDGETFDVAWHWRPGTLDMPHTPRLTPDGTLLIFDNGRHRGWSRLLEVDPVMGTRVWDWRADPREGFHSDVRGACQRLPNGNTLVTESERGRAFELSPAGEVVWEFLNPERRGNARKRIYRATRYTRERALPPESR